MSDDAQDVFARERRVFGEPPDLAAMDERVLAAYRREFGVRQDLWHRPLRVPLPLAALVLVGLLLCAALALRERPAESTTVRSAEPVQAVRYDPPVVTNTSLLGFEPVDEMQPIDVGKGKP
jgi:hypothetical protein